MSQERSLNKSVADTDAFITELGTVLLSAGWSLVDDQWAGSDYIVYKNNGGEDGSELDLYVRFNHSTADRIFIEQYVYWDSATHTGSYRLYYNNTTHGAIWTDDDGAFTIWIAANKDWITIMTRIGTSYYSQAVGKYVRYYDSPLGELQGNVSSGSDVVLQLAAGETNGFEVDGTYTICENSTNAQEVLTVTNVNKTNHQITVSSLSANWGTGAKIGFFPFPYVSLLNTIAGYNYVVHLAPNDTTTGDLASENGGYVSLGSYTNLDPDSITGFWGLTPFLIDGSGNYVGFSYEYYSYWRPVAINNFGDTIEVGRLDTGTATSSGTAATLQDTSKSWTVDEYIDKAVIITSGTGEGQISKIISNTSDTLTLDMNWVSAISTDSTYTICDEAWLGFMAASYGFGMRVV